MCTDARDGLAVVELDLDNVSTVGHRAPAQQAITLTTKVRNEQVHSTIRQEQGSYKNLKVIFRNIFREKKPFQ